MEAIATQKAISPHKITSITTEHTHGLLLIVDTAASISSVESHYLSIGVSKVMQTPVESCSTVSVAHDKVSMEMEESVEVLVSDEVSVQEVDVQFVMIDSFLELGWSSN